MFGNRKKFKTLFTIACTICVAFMVGYWFYKYDVEDRDIGVVDYAPLNHVEDIKFPSVSICFRDPFLFKRLRDINENITKETYRQYLGGEVYDKIYEQSEYANLSINLDRYFTDAFLILQNGTKLQEKYDSSAIVHTEVFNGFLRLSGSLDFFYKCVMMKYIGKDQRKVEEAYFYYDKNQLLHDWQEDEYSNLDMSIVVHYQNQFILANAREYYNREFSNREQGRSIWIDEFEILKRRNSRWRKCSTETDNYDNTVVEEIMRRKGCRPPYISGHTHYPKCDSKKKIRDAKIEVLTRRKMGLPKPCQRSSKIRRSTTRSHYRENEIDSSWDLRIFYPEEVKIITQSKDVDVHSLIGNIGGYLGLFLGRKNNVKCYSFSPHYFLKFVTKSLGTI